LEGGEIMDRLAVVRDELVSGVPEVARNGLKALIQRIDHLSGQGSAKLPESYRAGGDLWLPVRAVRVRMLLDAPNLLPRPREAQEGGTVGNLWTRGVRVNWLPLYRTRALLEGALQALRGSQGGGLPLAEVEEAQGAVTQTVRFDSPALLDAYYAVQRALAASRPWPEALRTRLRDAAQALYETDGSGDLPDQVQAIADALDPESGDMLDTARSLRKRIEAGTTAVPVTPAGDSLSPLRPERQPMRRRQQEGDGVSGPSR
jgi:hypothetical protein